MARVVLDWGPEFAVTVTPNGRAFVRLIKEEVGNDSPHVVTWYEGLMLHNRSPLGNAICAATQPRIRPTGLRHAV